jgi:hypothetical protein
MLIEVVVDGVGWQVTRGTDSVRSLGTVGTYLPYVRFSSQLFSTIILFISASFVIAILLRVLVQY